jgi:DHA2 family multidrug resistance protein-like MFS transporter
VLGSLGVAVYRTQVAAALPAEISPEMAEAVLETLGGAVAVATQLPDQLGLSLLNIAHQAFIRGLQLNALIGVIAFIGLAILTATSLRQVNLDAGPEQQPIPELDGLAPVKTGIQ